MSPNRSQSGRRRSEAGGIPRHPDTSTELQHRFAEAYGLVERSGPHQRALPIPERFTDIKLGNETLPVYEYLDEVVEAVHNNSVTICMAETGSGKSTQIPQALLEAGYKVTLTQPRRLAAEMLAGRITQEVIEKLGPISHTLVGYQTAERSTIGYNTRLAVVTDGLRLVQELSTNGEDTEQKEPEVLIIDETHERNTNIDVLIAWAQKRIAEGADLRVVFTTATMNAERLARHFNKIGLEVPIIEVPGRTYPVEQIERPESTVAKEVVRYAREGKNVLTFLPGVTEIDDTIAAVRRLLSNEQKDFVFLPLHSKLSPYEQHRVEVEYDGTILVFATNIAETSITIPSVDVIVDSGLERRIEITDEGTESLRVGDISQASCRQRGGRCGRTKPGTYVLTRLNDRVPFVSYESRDEYGTPEILRSNVDRTVLRVAAAGLDILQLDMLDKLDKDVIRQSKQTLAVLGALDSEYRITDRGLRMNTFPVRPSLSRMIVYAIENNYSEELRTQVIAMAAAVEGDGLPDYRSGAGTEWRRFVKEHTSDLTAQLDIFIAAHDMSQMELAENNLNIRAVERAKELNDKLLRRAKMKLGQGTQSPSEDQRELLRDAIVAGMIDFVYKKRGSEYARTSQLLGKRAAAVTLRSIGDRSTVHRGAEFVVATPYAIASPPGKDLPEKHILQDITQTTPAQLAKVAVSLCDWDQESHLVWRGGVPFVVQNQVFRGTVPTGVMRERPAEWSVHVARDLIDMILSQPGRNLRQILLIKKKSEELWRRSGTVEPLHQSRINEMLETVTGIRKKSMPRKPMTPGELDMAIEPYVEKFATVIPSEEMQEQIKEASPEFFEYQGISLTIDYTNGIPYIRRITDEIKNYLRATTGPLRLDDGRDILVPHVVGQHHRRMKVEDFRNIYAK